jgi:hypothetical protein
MEEADNNNVHNTLCQFRNIRTRLSASRSKKISLAASLIDITLILPNLGRVVSIPSGLSKNRPTLKKSLLSVTFTPRQLVRSIFSNFVHSSMIWNNPSSAIVLVSMRNHVMNATTHSAYLSQTILISPDSCMHLALPPPRRQLWCY